MESKISDIKWTEKIGSISLCKEQIKKREQLLQGQKFYKLNTYIKIILLILIILLFLSVSLGLLGVHFSMILAVFLIVSLLLFLFLIRDYKKDNELEKYLKYEINDLKQRIEDIK